MKAHPVVRILVLLVNCGVIGTACGDDNSVDAPGFAVARLVEVRQIALEESRTEFIGDIYHPAAVAFSSTGRIAVGDRMSARVLTYDPQGRLERATGTKGEGPGEFTGILAIGWDSTGRLWVGDQNRRVTVFRSDLSVDTTFSLTDAWPMGVQIVDDRAVMSLEKYPKAGDVFQILDGQGRPIRSFLPHDPLAREPYVGGSFRAIYRVVGDTVFAGSNLSYPLHIYTLDGDSIGTFGTPPPSIGTMRVPKYGEFMADMRLATVWDRSFGTGNGIWVVRDTLLLVEHKRPKPEPGPLVRDYFIDIYDRRTLKKIVEDLELPGFIVSVHDGLVWILTDRPPEPWTFTGHRLQIDR